MSDYTGSEVDGADTLVSSTPNSSGTALVGGTGDLQQSVQPGEWSLIRTRSQQPFEPTQLDEPGTGWLDHSKVASMVLLLRYELASP